MNYAFTTIVSLSVLADFRYRSLFALCILNYNYSDMNAFSIPAAVSFFHS